MHLPKFEIILARRNDEGVEEFTDPGEPGFPGQIGVVESQWPWATTVETRLPDNLGGPPTVMNYPSPGETHFGIVCFAPHSAGKREWSTQ